MADLTSNHDWETDPKGNVFATAGRTQRRWVRSTQERKTTALVKTAPPDSGREVYSLGMEWVAWKLGSTVGVPIPRVWLEGFGGQPAAILERIENQRDWCQGDAAPMLKTKIGNEGCWPISVAFDIWIANSDRQPRHILIQPDPPEDRVAVARECRVWFIDHGVSGLWFPSKFDPALGLEDTEKVDVGDGTMHDAAEKAARAIMPKELRDSLRSLDDGPMNSVLDGIRAITDDQIEQIIGMVPSAYMTELETEKTVALLKARRDRLDTLVNGYW